MPYIWNPVDLSFCDWLISFENSTVPSQSMLSHMIVFSSFLMLNNIDSIVAMFSFSYHMKSCKNVEATKYPLTDEQLMKRQCIHSLGTV